MIGDIFLVNFWLSLLIGGSLNCLLIWLICKKTVKEMKAYSRILLQTCALDLYMLIVAGLAQPIIVKFEGDNILFLNGPMQNLRPPYNFILGELWLYGLYFCSVSSAVQFLYRYLTLCRKIEVGTAYYILMICMGVLLVLVTSVLSLSYYPSNIDGISQKLSVFWDPQDKSKSLQISVIARPSNPIWYIFCSYVIVYNLLCYAIIVVCGIKIRSHIKKAAQGFDNPRFVETNRQLTVILVAQALLPFIDIAVTNTFLIASMFVSENTLFSLVYMLLPMHWQPALSPLITLFAVKSYRRSLNPFRSRRITGVTMFTSQPAVLPTTRKVY